MKTHTIQHIFDTTDDYKLSCNVIIEKIDTFFLKKTYKNKIINFSITFNNEMDCKMLGDKLKNKIKELVHNFCDKNDKIYINCEVNCTLKFDEQSIITKTYLNEDAFIYCIPFKTEHCYFVKITSCLYALVNNENKNIYDITLLINYDNKTLDFFETK